jgi:hypothetical protein
LLWITDQFFSKKEEEDMMRLSRQQREVLGLIHLSNEGCVLPYIQVERAACIREKLILELWPFCQENPPMLAALAVVCNAHPQALWWLHPYKDVMRLVGDAVMELLARRSMVGGNRTVPTCELTDETT